MTDKTNFENEIEETMRKSKLTKKEKELEDAFLEILGSKKLNDLAKNPGVKKHTWWDFHEIFYSVDNRVEGWNNIFLESAQKISRYPIKSLISESLDNTTWAIKLLKDFKKFNNLAKEYGKEIKNELGIIGITHKGGTSSTIKYDEINRDILSISIYKKNPNKFRDIIKSLTTKEIYSDTKFYDSKNQEYPIQEEDAKYVSKGLNKKRLQEIVIENWVKPLSYLQR